MGYAIDVINALDRMAHLYDKGAITHETIDYFSDIFPLGLALEEWLVDNELMTEDEVRHGSWTEFNEFCGREGMVAMDKEELPTPLLNIDQLILEEETRRSLDGIRKEIEYSKRELEQMKKELTQMKKKPKRSKK